MKASDERARTAIAEARRFLPRFDAQAADLVVLAEVAERDFQQKQHHQTYRELQDRAGEFEAFGTLIHGRLSEARERGADVTRLLDHFVNTKMKCLRGYIRAHSQFISKINQKVLESRSFPFGFLDQLRASLRTLDSLVHQYTHDEAFRSRLHPREIEIMREMRKFVEESWEGYKDLPDFGTLPRR